MTENLIQDEGAVALIDALGFRGIWGRYDPGDVLMMMKDMKDHLEERIAKQFETQNAMKCEIAFLSDTIAVSMALDKSIQHREAMSVIYLCDVISWILEWTLRSKVPLAYRGAIAVGSYVVSPHFLIGQAIDEAAAAHELAQGAFIWLTPTARDHVAEWLRSQPKNTHLIKFIVPLKGGDNLNTYTVSPLEQARDESDASLLVRTHLRTFSSGSIDVAVKRQNAALHMEACCAWRGFKISDESFV